MIMEAQVGFHQEKQKKPRDSCMRVVDRPVKEEQVITPCSPKFQPKSVRILFNGKLMEVSICRGGGHADLSTCDFHRVPMFSRQSIALE
jgi:hypothetical protein